LVSVSRVGADGLFVCSTNYGSLHFLRPHNIQLEIPYTTAAYVWSIDSSFTHGKTTTNSKAGFIDGQPLPGKFDSEPTIRCPWCNRRFSLPANLFDLPDRSREPAYFQAVGKPHWLVKLVSSIHRKRSLPSPSALSPERRASLGEVRCSSCSRPIRLNPF